MQNNGVIFCNVKFKLHVLISQIIFLVYELAINGLLLMKSWKNEIVRTPLFCMHPPAGGQKIELSENLRFLEGKDAHVIEYNVLYSRIIQASKARRKLSTFQPNALKQKNGNYNYTKL